MNKLRIIHLLMLSVFTIHASLLNAEEKKSAASPEKAETLQENEFYKLALQTLPGRSLHTFTMNDFRNQWMNINPDLHRDFTPQATEKFFKDTQALYALEIKTAREGISSSEEMTAYMEESGLLKEMEMDKTAILKAFAEIDVKKQLIQPISKFTQYYALTPPAVPVKLPAEFEPVGAVYVSWPIYDTFVWKSSANLVKEIRTSAEAWIFVPNDFWQKAVTLYLMKRNIDQSNIRFLHIPTDDVWARNWGQMNILTGTDQSPAFIRAPLIGYAGGQPYAKASSEAVAVFGQYMDTPVYQLPLVLEQGGNFITDGNGTMLCSEHVLNQNPDVGEKRFWEILRDYYGCTQVIMLPNQPGEICGHADIVVKFADPFTIFVASAEGTIWKESLDETARTLANSKSLSGKNFKVVRLPVPTNQILGKDSKDWSYINSLTMNKKIIVPLYGAPEDKQALKIYEETLPGYEIVGLDFHEYFFGAIHCQTQNVPPMVTKKVK